MLSHQTRWARRSLKLHGQTWRTADLIHSSPVALQTRIVCEPGAYLTEYPRRMLICGRDYSVVHPFSFTPCSHHAGAPQVCKMTRDFWLIGFQDFHQEADADLVIAHETE